MLRKSSKGSYLNHLQLTGHSHVHSVMGAFGLNASIMDASNLAWKMGLACKGRAKLDTIMATYNYERRDHACRIIEASGEYLRFVCNAAISIAHVRDPEEFSKHLPDGTSAVVLNGSSEKNGSGHIDGRFDEDATTNNVGSDQSPTHTNTNGVHKVNGFMSSEKNNEEEEQRATEEHQRDKDLQFLGNFFGRNGKFLLGVDAPFGVSSITHPENKSKDSVVNIKNGVRAPNPRVCFSADETGYLYDRMTGAATFHLILFASSLRGGVRRRVSTFASQVLGNNESFYHQYGGSSLFNILVVVKCLPDEVVDLMDEPALDLLRETGTIVYDDRAPDEDAHTTYRASHRTGAVVVVRPDLWVGTSALPDDIDLLESYFGDFLLRSR
jgi:phenol 2-monooxygenase